MAVAGIAGGQSPGWDVGDVVCRTTIIGSVVAFCGGVNDPVNPAAVQLVRAAATVTPVRFGTHPGPGAGNPGVTVPADEKNALPDGQASASAGSVIPMGPWTVAVSRPSDSDGEKPPVMKPAAVQARRAPATDSPSTCGTVRQLDERAGGVTAGLLPQSVRQPDVMGKFELAERVTCFPTTASISGVMTANWQDRSTRTGSPGFFVSPKLGAGKGVATGQSVAPTLASMSDS